MINQKYNKELIKDLQHGIALIEHKGNYYISIPDELKQTIHKLEQRLEELAENYEKEKSKKEHLEQTLIGFVQKHDLQKSFEEYLIPERIVVSNNKKN